MGTSDAMRIVFMGTPEYGRVCLEALVEAGYTVAGAFTQPDKPRGRGNRVTACPVKEYAEAHGIPVFQPRRIRLDGVDDLRRLSPDLCVTAAFGQILSEEVLAIPPMGTVNVHASLLPKYRGSAPIHYCILHGETVTGVTTMMTDKGMDTGDILLSRAVDILPGETSGELTERLARAGAALLIETIRRLTEGTCPRTPQNEALSSYDPLIKKEMGRLDFSEPATALERRVRAFTPSPGAYMETAVGAVRVLKAEAEPRDDGAKPGTVLCADRKAGLLIAAGEGALRILALQAPGGKAMPAKDYLLGHTIELITDKESCQ